MPDEVIRWPVGVHPVCVRCGEAPSHPFHTEEAYAIPGMAEEAHAFDVSPEDYALRITEDGGERSRAADAG